MGAVEHEQAQWELGQTDLEYAAMMEAAYQRFGLAEPHIAAARDMAIITDFLLVIYLMSKLLPKINLSPKVGAGRSDLMLATHPVI